MFPTDSNRQGGAGFWCFVNVSSPSWRIRLDLRLGELCGRWHSLDSLCRLGFVAVQGRLLVVDDFLNASQDLKELLQSFSFRVIEMGSLGGFR